MTVKKTVLVAFAVWAATYLPAADAFALSGQNHNEVLLVDD
jgi:hypothetical protein